VTELGLKRKILKADDEVGVYLKAQNVVAALSLWTRNEASIGHWYSGIDEFCQHLKSILEDYQIENNQVVHTSQKASRAMVEAIQLMNLPNSRLNPTIAHKLDLCGQIIAEHGTREQQEMFSKALKNYQHSDINFFLPLLRNFEKYLQEFAALLTGNQVTEA